MSSTRYGSGATHENRTKWTKSSFIGQIDEVRVWNVARTVDEIRSDMNTATQRR